MEQNFEVLEEVQKYLYRIGESVQKISCGNLDIERPNGDYDNVVPGGFIRETKKMNNKNTENILACKSVLFYGKKDKDAFFEWLEKIDCIDEIFGSGNELYIFINCDEIPDHNLRDLLALFQRYNIDMKQLARYLADDNKKWFYDNKAAYWHEKVFSK